MKKETKWLIAGVIVMAVLFTLSFILIDENTICTYEGKETFYTEQEYAKFKLVIGNEAVEIQEIDVLSSSPPIVVNFTIESPLRLDFQYGERQGLFSGGISYMLLWAGIVIGVLSLFGYGIFNITSD